MSENEFNQLRELSWRRPLTAVEEARLQAYLQANPGQQAAWEEESAFTHALNQLPPAPLSSNFTALVLQAIDQPDASRQSWGARWRRWLPRLSPGFGLAACSILILAGYAGYHTHSQRQQQLEGLGLIMTAMPTEVDAFANFDAIQKLGSEANTDETLWVALNQ